MFADGVSTTTQMVPTDDGCLIPAIYGEFVEVFSKAKVQTVPPHQSTDHAIDLEPSYNVPYWRSYNILEFELRTFKAYIEANLPTRFIQWSSSPMAAPIHFARRKDGGSRLWVDYRVLNKVTLEIRYPLFLILEMVDHARGTKIFTKLKVCSAYYLILIKECNEYKMDFPTRYGQCQYWVKPSGLTNVLAIFQSYIDDCL